MLRARASKKAIIMPYDPQDLRHSQSRQEATAKTADALDVAARYLVYKLYVPGRGMTEAWHPLSTLGEAAATVARAVERGLVTLRDEGQGRTRERYATLTDTGRQVARKRLR